MILEEFDANDWGSRPEAVKARVLRAAELRGEGYHVDLVTYVTGRFRDQRKYRIYATLPGEIEVKRPERGVHPEAIREAP